MRSRLETRIAVWAMAVLLAAPAMARGQAASEDAAPPAGAAGVPADIAAAHDFVFAVYPDLIGRDLAITVVREGEAVLVSVVDHGATPAQADAGATPAPVVTARIVFDAGTRLRRYDAYGPLVHEAENLALQTQLIAEPRWIDSDADAWLIGRGAASTFAPPGAAVAERAGALASRLATKRTAEAGTFRWYADETESPGRRIFHSRPAWIVEAAGTTADGTLVTYQFAYEPFGGRLIAVTQQGAQ